MGLLGRPSISTKQRLLLFVCQMRIFSGPTISSNSRCPEKHSSSNEFGTYCLSSFSVLLLVRWFHLHLQRIVVVLKNRRNFPVRQEIKQPNTEDLRNSSLFCWLFFSSSSKILSTVCALGLCWVLGSFSLGACLI